MVYGLQFTDKACFSLGVFAMEKMCCWSRRPTTSKSFENRKANV
jgi:hypothetical protein